MITFTHEGERCMIKGHLSQNDVIALWPKKSNLLKTETKILDISQLEYSDTSGLAFLFELLSLAESKEHNLVLVSPSEQVKKLIQLYDLKHFFCEQVV